MYSNTDGAMRERVLVAGHPTQALIGVYHIDRWDGLAERPWRRRLNRGRAGGLQRVFQASSDGRQTQVQRRGDAWSGVEMEWSGFTVGSDRYAAGAGACQTVP